jgi:hypothetical protein
VKLRLFLVHGIIYMLSFFPLGLGLNMQLNTTKGIIISNPKNTEAPNANTIKNNTVAISW